jgi:hypothetical protein
MKFPVASARYLFLLLLLAGISGCHDIESLLLNSNKKPNTQTRAEGSAAVASAEKAEQKIPAPCHFTGTPLPENLEVYAIDGQAWIEQFHQANSAANAIPSIHITLVSSTPMALLITARQAANWHIKSNKPDTLWGVYATAEEPQRVLGVSAPTRVQEHYSAFGDQCGFYWTKKLQVYALYDFTKVLFGKPYIALPTVNNGKVHIQSIEPMAAKPQIEKVSIAVPAFNKEKTPELAPINQPVIAVKAAPKFANLNDALRAYVIRPGTPGDLDRFKQRYASANNKAVGKNFDESFLHRSLYVITSDFTYPEGLYGAHSVTFIIENRVPYPQGNPGHSVVLDMNTGACIGFSCSSLLSD